MIGELLEAVVDFFGPDNFSERKRMAVAYDEAWKQRTRTGNPSITLLHDRLDYWEVDEARREAVRIDEAWAAGRTPSKVAWMLRRHAVRHPLRGV